MKLTRKNLTFVLLAAVAVMAVFTLAGHPLISPEMLAGIGMVPMAIGEVSLTDINKAIEESNKAFEAFKAANDQKGAAQSDKLATLEKSFADVMKFGDLAKDLQKKVEDMEAKASRPGFGSGKTDAELVADEHKQAFGGYLRKGKEFDLALEQKALAISTNGGADGGFAVPKVIDAMIQDLLVNISPIRSIAAVQQISTSDFHKLVNLRGTASGWAPRSHRALPAARPRRAHGRRRLAGQDPARRRSRRV